jgi:hypothetical protein
VISIKIQVLPLGCSLQTSTEPVIMLWLLYWWILTNWGTKLTCSLWCHLQTEQCVDKCHSAWEYSTHEYVNS